MTPQWTTHSLKSGEMLALPRFRLKVIKGPDKGASTISSGGDLTAGTLEGNDLRLTDPTVSRNHLVFEATRRGLRLRDLGSTNGILVAGVQLEVGIVEPPVDIDIGETRLRLSAEKEAVEVPIYPGERFGPLLGVSVEMRRIFALLERVAASQVTVLLMGETGTGKDLAAEAVHRASPRADGPFVVVDCGAVAESLIESELFGHEKGAFTGATGRRVGAFEAADKGTVFLDEIGELPLHMQPKLLRVLEKRTVKPLGSNDTREVDVRFIAATHRDLRTEVNKGTFREDLYFRLSVVTVRMPPLRERRTDIPLLVDAFLRACSPRAELSGAFRKSMDSYDWPGNARELRHAVERAVTLGVPHMSEERNSDDKPGPERAKDEADPSVPFKDAKQKVVDRFERAYLAALLDHTDGNVSAAARQAAIDRVHLLKLLRRHGLR